jgi:hypothetical protein
MSDQLYTRTSADVDLRDRKAFEQLTLATRTAVEQASIVLVPDDGFREFTGPVFPQGTVDFFQFLREHAPRGADVAIAAEDATYKEVVLHSDIVRIATLFVEYVGAPVVLSLISAYLKDFLGSRLKSADARAAIIVHRKDGSVEQTVRISYEGPAQNVEAALTAAIATLPTRTGEMPPVTAPVTQRTTPHQFGRKKGKQRRK